MDSFDDYARRYLAQWDKRATVRGMPRYRLTAGPRAAIQLPLAAVPLARHPHVQALGPDAVEMLLTHAATEWQAQVARVEVAVVADLCGKLAAGVYDFRLSAAARQVALTIATDEMYHAYVARECLLDLAGPAEADAGDDRPPSPIEQALALIRRSVDPRFVAGAEIMALCFCENLVTEELMGFSRHDGNPAPFHIIAREHLIDEGRHQRYFTVLLTHVWASISPAHREALAAVLPAFLDAFLDDPASRRDATVAMLGKLGLDEATSEAIFTQARPPATTPKFARMSSANTMKLIAAAGLDRDPASRDALVAGGWLPAHPQA